MEVGGPTSRGIFRAEHVIVQGVTVCGDQQTMPPGGVTPQGELVTRFWCAQPKATHLGPHGAGLPEQEGLLWACVRNSGSSGLPPGPWGLGRALQMVPWGPPAPTPADAVPTLQGVLSVTWAG